MLVKSFISALGKATVFFLGYFATVITTLVFSQLVWPEGLQHNAQFIFWPASGVALFFTIRFGPAYAPAILLAVLPAVFLVQEPFLRALLGALGNLFEVWVAWFVLVRLAGFDGSLDRVRTVVGLMAASLLGGATASVSYPLLLSFTDGFDYANWDATLIRYAFANSCGSMLVIASIYALRARPWRAGVNWGVFLLWFVLTCLISGFAFNAVFVSKLNYAFLLFPLVLFAAVRFGSWGCVTALLLVAGGMYLSLARFGGLLTETEILPVIQFLQGFIWVLTVTSLFIAALVSERRQAQAIAAEEKNRSLEAKLHEERARLEALRYQIHPHFLFNSLNSVSATLPGSNREGRSMIRKMSDYLRTVLEHPPSDLLPLREEIALVEKYLAIEKQRYGENLRVTTDFDPAALSVPVPALMLQPLTENAIRHGFADGQEPLSLEISAQVTGGQLAIRVVNTGRWVEPEESSGIGLANIRRRLKLLYSGSASLEVEKEADRVVIQIVLPVSQIPAAAE